MTRVISIVHETSKPSPTFANYTEVEEAVWYAIRDADEFWNDVDPQGNYRYPEQANNPAYAISGGQPVYINHANDIAALRLLLDAIERDQNATSTEGVGK